MGFSFLGAFGGAAKQLTTEYAQDRLAEKQRQAQMLGIFLPELISERKERKLKKRRMRELNVALSRYITDDDINLRYNLLAAGEERAKAFVDDMASWEQKTGKRLNNVAEFEKLGMLPPGYEPPKETYENFDDFFKQRIVGNIVPYISDKSSDLQKSIAKSLGARSPEMLKDSVYAQLAAFSGDDISTVASDIEGTRDIQEALAPGLLSKPLDPLEAIKYQGLIKTQEQINAGLDITVNVNALDQEFKGVGLAVAEKLVDMESKRLTGLYNKARALSEKGESTDNQKKIGTNFRGMLSQTAKTIANIMNAKVIADAKTGEVTFDWPGGEKNQLLKRVAQHAVSSMASLIHDGQTSDVDYGRLLKNTWDEAVLIDQVYISAAILDAQVGDGKGTAFYDRLTLPGKGGITTAVWSRRDRGTDIYNATKTVTVNRLNSLSSQAPAALPTAVVTPSKRPGFIVIQKIASVKILNDPTVDEKNDIRSAIETVLPNIIAAGKLAVPTVQGRSPNITDIMDLDWIGKRFFGLPYSINKAIESGELDKLKEYFKKI
jgi:hypothetical protein